MTPLVLVVALTAGPSRSPPLLKPASPTAIVALRMRGGAADREVKQSDVDAMRNALVAVRNLSAVLAVLISLSYVKPLYRQFFKDSFERFSCGTAKSPACARHVARLDLCKAGLVQGWTCFAFMHPSFAFYSAVVVTIAHSIAFYWLCTRLFFAPWIFAAFVLHSWRPKCYSAALKDIKWPKEGSSLMIRDPPSLGAYKVTLVLWAFNAVALLEKDHGWGAILSFWNDVPRPVFFLTVAALAGTLMLKL